MAHGGFCLIFFFLQALSYTGSHMKVHLPSLVENEILKEDGSVIKRFGLAWGYALPTNTLTFFSSCKKNRAPTSALTSLGNYQVCLRCPLCQAVDLSVCQTCSVLLTL